MNFKNYNAKFFISTFLLVVFCVSYIDAHENSDTHFRSGIFGTPPKQYEFKSFFINFYVTTFPLDSIKKAIGNEFNEIKIDYWLYTTIEDLEMAMVEKMELLSLSLKNTINSPIEDIQIGENCWQSIEETGSVLFSRNNVMVFITPQDNSSFDPKMIAQSAQKIDSVLFRNRDARSGKEVPAPEILNLELMNYPQNWDDSLRIRIEVTNPDSTNQNIFFRKYGTSYDEYSDTELLTTSLIRSTDSIDYFIPARVKIWVWNEKHIVSSISKSVYFMIYPEKYMLTDKDLPGFDYLGSGIHSWQTGVQKGVNGIRQSWRTTTKDNEDILTIDIDYFEFQNEPKAIIGTFYDSHVYSGILNYGTPMGELVGNISYVGDFSTYCIQKWNIGFQIWISSNSLTIKKENLASISNIILTKINDSIPESYIRKDIDLRKNQIPENEYNELNKDAIILLKNRNFNSIKTDDTKWAYSEDSLIMGLRKQWTNEKALFTIDAVKLDSERDARLVGRERETFDWNLSPYCNLANKDSIDQAFDILPWYFNSKLQFISATGVIDNYAIFFQYQDKDSIDFEYFKSVLKSFADNAMSVENIKQNTIQIYPNPANETLTIETQNPETTFAKLLDSTGRLIKTLPIENGTNTYKISELESGVYFIQIPGEESAIVRKIVKN